MNFSETYYPTIQGYRLTPEQHKANNQWFAEMLDKLKDDGILYIPVLHRSFNKKGEEVLEPLAPTVRGILNDN